MIVNKDNYVESEGEVVQSLPNAMFKVLLDNGHEILCNISGKIRMNYINIMAGDRVVVDIPVIDPTKGRIKFRTRSK